MESFKDIISKCKKPVYYVDDTPMQVNKIWINPDDFNSVSPEEIDERITKAIEDADIPGKVDEVLEEKDVPSKEEASQIAEEKATAAKEAAVAEALEKMPEALKAEIEDPDSEIRESIVELVATLVDDLWEIYTTPNPD